MTSSAAWRIFGLLALVLAAGCDPDNRPARQGGDEDFTDEDGGDEDMTDQDPSPCHGTASHIVVGNAQTLEALAEDPERCLLYGLDRTASEVYFIDTRSDVVAATVTVGTEPQDLTLSADKAFLYVAVFGESKIVKLDAASGGVIEEVTTALPPYRIARGPDDRVYYVEEAVFTAVYEVNFASDEDRAVTGIDFHEPDLDASEDGLHLYLGESSQPGSRLFHLDGGDDELSELDEFVFDGGFTLPSPERRIHLGRGTSNRVYFADRAFAADDLARMRGWLSEQPVTSTVDGKLVASDESVFDGQTFVRISQRVYPEGGALFSHDGYWFYEFEPDGSRLHRTAVTTIVGTHQLGETTVPPGSLAQRRFKQLLADPSRPILYGLDDKANTIVFIDRDTLLPIRAEVIGSAPTDMAITADGNEMVVATFGATEVAILDLNSTTKALKEVLYVPGNPFKVAVSAEGRIVYAEQDQFCDVTMLDRESGDILSSTESNAVFQPDVEFDESGQYLFAGEARGSAVYLRRFDVSSGQLLEVTTSESTFDNPTRRVIYNNGFVYYAGRKFDATTLEELHDFDDDIVLVTPDGHYAVSQNNVYDLQDPAHAAIDVFLPVDSDLIAVSPDSTVLYQFDHDTGTLFVQGLPSD